MDTPTTNPVAFQPPKNFSNDIFPATPWHLLRKMHEGESDPISVFNKVIPRYEKPVLAYLKACNFSKHDAEDIKQGFFAKISYNHELMPSDPAIGKLRSWMLVSLKNSIFTWLRKEKAGKRGGQFVHLQMTGQFEPVDHLSPDVAFDHCWSLTILETAYDELKTMYADQGKGNIFRQLRERIYVGRKRCQRTYEQIGKDLGLSKSQVSEEVKKMRERFEKLYLAEVARTVKSTEEFKEELKHLQRAIKASL